MHLNEKVRSPLKKILGDEERAILVEPLNYKDLVVILKNCYFLLTDSGGLQEEAPSLGKPVLVMRNTTERPEGILAGTTKLVGTSINSIFQNTDKLLRDTKNYQQMVKKINPYGDGNASKRILKILKKEL